MMEPEPLLQYEANEWRVVRAGRLLFRARSQKDAQAWIAAHYLPLAAGRAAGGRKAPQKLSIRAQAR